MRLFETRMVQEDVNKISKVLSSGNIGFGENVNIFEDMFLDFSKKKNNIACNSASAASFMIFSYLKDKFGVCDVYTTSLGFTSPAWCAKHFGHNLVFVDVQDDLQFSCEYYRKIRKDTKNKVVLMPVLYGGVSNIDNFEVFGDEIIVVDSAHCVTPAIKSDFIFFSFHPYKPICTSDGGMISTDMDEAANYFNNYRNFGRISKNLTYDIKAAGFKFYMNNLNATIGITQIKRYNKNLKERKDNYNLLSIKRKLLKHDSESSYYFGTTITDNADEIIKRTRWARNYPMLHKMSYYDNGTRLPILEKVHHKILNIPLWCQVGDII